MHRTDRRTDRQKFFFFLCCSFLSFGFFGRPREKKVSRLTYNSIRIKVTQKYRKKNIYTAQRMWKERSGFFHRSSASDFVRFQNISRMKRMEMTTIHCSGRGSIYLKKQNMLISTKTTIFFLFLSLCFLYGSAHTHTCILYIRSPTHTFIRYRMYMYMHECMHAPFS